MLFSSYEFILLFLPIVIVLYYSIQKYSFAVANGALVCASLFFYAWWEPKYLLLLLSSMIGNFYLGRQLLPSVSPQTISDIQRKWILAASIVVNLGLLGYFKYAFFIASNIDAVAGTVLSPAVSNIVLPLAISFFTFQQIAYLVDSYKGLRKPESFVNYALFISFFPQLIAGPIVHHQEMMSQFLQQKRLDWNNITRGLMIFMVGLFKKVVFADNVAPYANRVFGAAQAGVDLTFFEAWGGALAYTFQLYFDFSGYADMAIGAALIFGIYLPLNFNSPYKSVNIIEFWRRWHMTLGRFLRDYVYIPLGGNRSGNLSRHRNLFATMLIGGIWHGAGWNFLIWGALHGSYLVGNHGWVSIKKQLNINTNYPRIWQTLSIIFTFILVVIAWVFFRATDFNAAMTMLTGMFGGNGIMLPPQLDALGSMSSLLSSGDGWLGIFESKKGLLLLIFLGAIAFTMPNTAQIFRFAQNDEKPALFVWRKCLLHAGILSVISVIAMFYINSENEFLYFQF